MNMFTVLELRRRSRSRMTTAAAALAVTTLLAACGGGGGGGGGGVSDGGTVATAPAAAATAATAAAATSVTAAAATSATAAAATSATATAAPGVGEGTAVATAAPGTTGDTGNAAASTTATATPLVLRARGTLAGGIGPIVQVRIAGQVVASIEVKASTFTDHNIDVPTVAPGTIVDIVFTNDALINGEDRNLFVAYVAQSSAMAMPGAVQAVYDRGSGAAAFDGLDVIAAQGTLAWGGALRITWPATTTADPAALARAGEASRFLQQATFGPTRAEVERVQAIGAATWIGEQLRLPVTPDFVNAFQAKMDQGLDFVPPIGKSYTPAWNVQTFWRTAVQAPDQLRKRTAFALQQVFTASLADGNLWGHGRAYAGFLDGINRHAFGNYRALLEEVALSPVMGIYLSHLRSQKEDGAGRMPDENFARELMQLFSIGLLELNPDGTPKLNAAGNPIETYTNDDVMAMARVFTGWAWGFDDAQLTANNFRRGNPDMAATGAARVDLRPMKNYADFHSLQEKRLFAGKPWGVTIPAGTPGPQSLKMALDALHLHPNTGPFISHQLIQRLVTSNPSPAYVQRVAQLFANNGRGVRGDLAAVVRAILQDVEARPALPGPGHGKLREPVLRVAHFLRSFGGTSANGNWLMDWDLAELLQRPLYAPSVFGFFRPGYIPPNTALADAGMAAPELQIASESTVAGWVNRAEIMIVWGLGWNGIGPDITATLAFEASLAASGPGPLLDHLNTTLFAGRMSDRLRRAIVDAVAAVPAISTTRDRDRARVALFLALASPEYLVQR